MVPTQATAQTSQTARATTPSRPPTTPMPEAIAEVAAELKQWRIFLPGTGAQLRQKAEFGVKRERNFALYGKVPDRYLQHEDQMYGINLGWTDDDSTATRTKVTRWFVDRSGTGDGPVLFGERIALGNGGDPSFIRYADRFVGVNLDWSTKPVYEWRFVGGTPGTPIEDGATVAIYNDAAGSDASPGNFLIYFDRTRGGDLGWPDSKTWWEQARSKIGSLAGNAAKEFVKDYFGV